MNLHSLKTAVDWIKSYERDLLVYVDREFLSADQYKRTYRMQRAMEWNQWRIVGAFLGLSNDEMYRLWSATPVHERMIKR